MPPSTESPASSLWELKTRELLTRTASADPTPGGGSVAAISGAFGLALVQMALAVSLRGKEERADLNALHQEAGELLMLMLPHPDADVTAFQGYMDALALPKADEGERATRRGAMQAAARSATQAPLSAARDLLAGLELAQRGRRAGPPKRRLGRECGRGAAGGRTARRTADGGYQPEQPARRRAGRGPGGAHAPGGGSARTGSAGGLAGAGPADTLKRAGLVQSRSTR